VLARSFHIATLISGSPQPGAVAAHT
jgi:hypothetical protein